MQILNYIALAVALLLCEGSFAFQSMTTAGRQSNKLLLESSSKKILSYEELEAIRDEADEISIKLIEGVDDEDESLQLIKELEAISSQDPERLYAQVLDKIKEVEEASSGEDDEIERLWNKAKSIRDQLPHFNLDGYWVGRYDKTADKGKYDMIKVTYEQNTNLLIARKVTSGGGVNATIPVGEISFQADLSPSCYSIDENAGECLLPLDDLPQELIKRWDERKLVRFPGKGQIADPGFQNCEWVRGELVLVDMNDFIFVWEDHGFQIFFSRPPKYLWDGARETNEEELGDYPGYF